MSSFIYYPDISEDEFYSTEVSTSTTDSGYGLVTPHEMVHDSVEQEYWDGQSYQNASTFFF